LRESRRQIMIMQRCQFRMKRLRESVSVVAGSSVE